uniref:Uncharacterized protein n=1 Tax=Siphoviridae sp. ctMgQ24 TaxID=2826263 RepID=A0A8S5QQA6_9CAUD|nr:MAG TPA: hypothetical protein [Siphoviridae sp. ctMgQ24]
MRNSPKIKIAQTALTPRAVLCCEGKERAVIP